MEDSPEYIIIYDNKIDEPQIVKELYSTDGVVLKEHEELHRVETTALTWRSYKIES